MRRALLSASLMLSLRSNVFNARRNGSSMESISNEQSSNYYGDRKGVIEDNRHKKLHPSSDSISRHNRLKGNKRVKISYLCTVIEKFGTITSLQQKCLAMGNISQLLTKAVNLNRTTEQMHVEKVHNFAWEKMRGRGEARGGEGDRKEW